MLNNITFAYPWILYFLVLIPLMALWYWFKGRNSQTSINYSSLNIFRGLKPTWRERLKYLPNILRMLAVALLIIALARPQNFESGENVYSEGIDIAMVLDISGSMLAEDLKPSRIEAAKEVIDEFIQGKNFRQNWTCGFCQRCFYTMSFNNRLFCLKKSFKRNKKWND